MAFDVAKLTRGTVYVAWPGGWGGSVAWKYTTTDNLSDVLYGEIFSDSLWHQTYFGPGVRLFQSGDTIWVEASDGSQLMAVGTVYNDPFEPCVDIQPVANISAI